MTRPTASVVVPFAGSSAELQALLRRLADLNRRAGDEAIVADNSRAPGSALAADGVRVVPAPGVPSSYFARNAGAERARGEWLVFVDADVEPIDSLLDAYFDPLPSERTTILAGGVRDHPEGDSTAARLARDTDAMSQARTLHNPYMPYAITANCAIRADAFREAGGFEPRVRSGGDADLCWRLQRMGWEIEERPGALVHHRNRATMREIWSQRARHGAGAAWLERRYPGSMPAWGLPSLLRHSTAAAANALVALAQRDPGRALVQLAKASGWWAFELGRRGSNTAPRR